MLNLRDTKQLLSENYPKDKYHDLMHDILNAQFIYDVNFALQLLANDKEPSLEYNNNLALALINNRSILTEFPRPPFDIAIPLEDFVRIAGFRNLGKNTYVKEYNSKNDLFYMIEILGEGNLCQDLRFHRDFNIWSIYPEENHAERYIYNERFIDWYIENNDSVDNLKELLTDMGLVFNPRVYTNLENFYYEHLQDYLSGISNDLF